MSLENKIDQLFAEIGSLKETLKILEKKVTDLESEHHTLKDKLHKKNSSNSSIPPSKDKNRVKPNQALRQKIGRNTDGQKGHSGNYLKMHSTPDVVIEHKSKYSKCCRDKLGEIQELVGKRQVFDIPPNEIYTGTYTQTMGRFVGARYKFLGTGKVTKSIVSWNENESTVDLLDRER